MSNTKLKEIEIPITISTNYFYENEADRPVLTIENATYFLSALGWFIDTLSEVAENTRVFANPELPEHFDKEMFWNTQYIVRIMRAISGQLTEFTGDILTVHQKKVLPESKREEPPKVLDLSNQVADDEYTILARHISALLKNEKSALVANAIVADITKYHPEITRFSIENLAEMLREQNGKVEKAEDETPSILDLSSQTTAEDSCIDLAKQISSILNNPDTPEMVAGHFQQALTDAFNENEADGKAFLEFQRTPEYIEMILKSHGCGGAE